LISNGYPNDVYFNKVIRIELRYHRPLCKIRQISSPSHRIYHLISEKHRATT